MLAQLQARAARNKLRRYQPYTKQREFHAAGGKHRERLLSAGNQLGKTFAGAMETAMHLTGRYPAWWEGRRFERPVRGWAGAVNGKAAREGVQQLLLGPAGSFGTGAIPAECVVKTASAHGTADLVDTIHVRHESGAVSLVTLKTYEQGREAWQAASLDFVWLDEEPPADLYTEALTRTNATGGLVWMTFTPLKGMSDVARRFFLESGADRHLTRMELTDAGHFTPEQIAAIEASYPAHERDARLRGIPVLGSGNVFPVPEESIRYQDIRLGALWPRICGLDFGWEHPTAAVWLAWDRDADCAYLYDCYRVSQQTPAIHTVAIRARGAWIPIAWPHDGLQHDKGSGKTLASIYRDAGANMLPEHARFETTDDGAAQTGLEAGVTMMLERMQSGRLKVAAHLVDWWEEFRFYHRKDGLIVKERDDLMSSTRYALMMLRHAKVEQAAAPIKYDSRWIV